MMTEEEKKLAKRAAKGKYYLKNRDRYLEAGKRYREKHKKRLKIQGRKYREENKEKIKKRNRKYYQDNPQALKELKRRIKYNGKRYCDGVIRSIKEMDECMEYDANYPVEAI